MTTIHMSNGKEIIVKSSHYTTELNGVTILKLGISPNYEVVAIVPIDAVIVFGD